MVVSKYVGISLFLCFASVKGIVVWNNQTSPKPCGRGSVCVNFQSCTELEKPDFRIVGCGTGQMLCCPTSRTSEQVPVTLTTLPDIVAEDSNRASGRDRTTIRPNSGPCGIGSECIPFQSCAELEMSSFRIVGCGKGQMICCPIVRKPEKLPDTESILPDIIKVDTNSKVTKKPGIMKVDSNSTVGKNRTTIRPSSGPCDIGSECINFQSCAELEMPNFKIVGCGKSQMLCCPIARNPEQHLAMRTTLSDIIKVDNKTTVHQKLDINSTVVIPGNDGTPIGPCGIGSECIPFQSCAELEMPNFQIVGCGTGQMICCPTPGTLEQLPVIRTTLPDIIKGDGHSTIDDNLQTSPQHSSPSCDRGSDCVPDRSCPEFRMSDFRIVRCGTGRMLCCPTSRTTEPVPLAPPTLRDFLLAEIDKSVDALDGRSLIRQTSHLCGRDSECVHFSSCPEIRMPKLRLVRCGTRGMICCGRFKNSEETQATRLTLLDLILSHRPIIVAIFLPDDQSSIPPSSQSCDRGSECVHYQSCPEERLQNFPIVACGTSQMLCCPVLETREQVTARRTTLPNFYKADNSTTVGILRPSSRMGFRQSSQACGKDEECVHYRSCRALRIPNFQIVRCGTSRMLCCPTSSVREPVPAMPTTLPDINQAEGPNTVVFFRSTRRELEMFCSEQTTLICAPDDVCVLFDILNANVG